MKTYKVTITETLRCDVFVEAESRLQAEQITKDDWSNGEYILDADHFQGVDFKAHLAEQEHER